MKDDILAALDGLPVVAAFIYGSVARGTATQSSDIDVFVVLEHQVAESQVVELKERFRDLQARLGYTPDPRYPVEVFTVDDLWRGGSLAQPDEDQREIRRALADRKIMLIGSPEDLP